LADLLNAVAAVEGLGSVGLLILGLLVSLWCIRHLYLRGEECDKARLEDALDRARMNRELGELSGKVNTITDLHSQHLQALLRERDNHNHE